MFDWIVQHHTAAGSTFADGWTWFAEDLEVASGGQLNAPLHSGGAIVPAMVELDGIHEGVLDLASSCTMYWRDRFGPATNLFTYQIAGLRPVEQFFWMQLEGMDLLQEMAAGYNVTFIGGFVTVPEIFISTKLPLTGPEDIDGLKLRTAGDDGTIFQQMGAAVTTLSTEETYEATMRGVIDGFQLGSPGYDYSVATYEVIDYVYLGSVRQPCEWQPIMVNTDSWNALPDSLKKMLTEMGKAAGMNYYRYMTQRDLETVPLFREKGTTVTFIPDSIGDEMQTRGAALYEDYEADDPFFRKVWNSIQNFRDTYRDAWQGM
ncbi:MAG: TRAP transporter substrate-binding protein DctP [Dehalococcoidales bacterium]|nr:TRAP transporter substrate-binding protein DctP [Dehalococcoidales bacterium]